MTDIDQPAVRSTPRRVTPPPSKRRRHPAAGARIVAAGFGASTMFGLVATMGIAHVRAESTPSSTDEMVAVVPTPAATAALRIVPVPAPAAAPAVAPAAAGAPAAPIVLQARPDVRVVTPPPSAAAAPTPVATTRGSN